MTASEDQSRLNSDRAQDSELEQYGVWVKAGPEDVDESEAEDGAFALTDLGDEAFDAGESDSPGFDLDLEADELEADELETDELDLEDLAADESTDAPPADSPPGGAPEADAEYESVPPADPGSEGDDDLLTLDDDDFGLLMGDEADGPEESRDQADREEPSELEELDLDDLTTDVEEESARDSASIDIDEELPGDLDDLTLDLDTLDVDSFEESGDQTAEEPVPDTPPRDETDELELLELEPEETEEPAQEQAPREADSVETAAPAEDDELDLDALQLDDEAELAELDLSSLPGDPDTIDEDPQDVSESAEDDLPELEIDDDMGDDLGLDEMFDDVGAVEDEMTETAAAEPAPDHEGRSAALLESIEHELSSIRTELADLKQELSKLRRTPAAAAPTRDTPESADDAAGGFFEDEGDDDDETIALTGAELDNIMNTAEFTEQPGRPTEFDETSAAADASDEPQDAGEFPDVNDILDSVDLAPPEEEIELDSPVQEITLEETPDQTDTIDLDLDLGTAEEPEEPEEQEPLPVFEGSDDEIEALASMDIDAELADIEELEDMSAPPPADAEPSEDTAPLDAEYLDEIPQTDEAREDRAEEGPDSTADEMSLDEPFIDEPVIEESPGPAATDAEEPESVAPLPDDATPIPENLKGELRSVLNYMDKLLESLPEEKIQEFAASEHFKVYRRLFEELGLEQ